MATQNAARAHKVEVVDEVKTRMSAATASIVSEYRGLTVAELADLRQALATAGGDYKIFKNTLVRRAIDGGDYQPLSEYLSGPSALTFVQGDISAVAADMRVLTSSTTSTLWARAAFCVAIGVLHRDWASGPRCATAQAGGAGCEMSPRQAGRVGRFRTRRCTGGLWRTDSVLLRRGGELFGKA